MLGTPSYMSPEQILGLPIDGRSDLFSAGVILYQFLTGERPFTGSSTVTMHKVLEEEPLPPSRFNVQVPGAMDAVVRKALAKRPDERFQTAEEFADALRAAAQRESARRGRRHGHRVERPDGDSRAGTEARRRAPAAAMTPGGTPDAHAPAAPLPRTPRRRAHPHRARPRRSRRQPPLRSSAVSPSWRSPRVSGRCSSPRRPRMSSQSGRRRHSRAGADAATSRASGVQPRRRRRRCRRPKPGRW